MANRHYMYNAELELVWREERAGRAFVFRPKQALPIGHISHDPAEMQVVYDIGREDAKRRLQELREFLQS